MGLPSSDSGNIPKNAPQPSPASLWATGDRREVARIPTLFTSVGLLDAGDTLVSGVLAYAVSEEARGVPTVCAEGREAATLSPGAMYRGSQLSIVRVSPLWLLFLRLGQVEVRLPDASWAEVACTAGALRCLPGSDIEAVDRGGSSWFCLR